MDGIFATLLCCLLALRFPEAQTNETNLDVPSTATLTTFGLILTNTTMTENSTSTVNTTLISSLTEDTSPFTGSSQRATAESTESINNPDTYQSTTAMTPQTNSASLTITTRSTQKPTFNATAQEIQTTAGYTSTPNGGGTTAASSATVNTTSDSVARTKGLKLHMSDKILTILFSVVLGALALASAMLMFNRCKHRIQYTHQPLKDPDDMDTFATDDDTLVISGGLYDGYPIYDDVPTTPADQSQFHLEFLQEGVRVHDSH